MRQNVFSDFAVAVLAQLHHEGTKPVSRDIEILKMLVRVFGSLRLRVLREGKLFLTCLQNVATTA